MQRGVRDEVLCSFGWRVRRQHEDREVVERGGGDGGSAGQRGGNRVGSAYD